jgi:N-terminal domain of anti-restriction factor ArdC
MSRSAACARTGRDRPSLYQEITHKIIAELEAGRVPWVQPWGTVQAKASLTMPRNATTQRHYSGINVLILWGAVIEHGFSAQNWITFRQALGLGANVRKGQHGTTVVYADRFVPDEERQRAERDGDEPNAILRFTPMAATFRSVRRLHLILCAWRPPQRVRLRAGQSLLHRRRLAGHRQPAGRLRRRRAPRRPWADGGGRRRSEPAALSALSYAPLSVLANAYRAAGAEVFNIPVPPATPQE